MNIQAEKLRLQRVNSELNAYDTDLWDELSEEQKSSVKRARHQLVQGEGKPHKEVMKKYEKFIV